MDVIDTSTNQPIAGNPFPITFTLTGFSVTVPLVGTTPPGSLAYGILVGDVPDASDRAPNGAVPAESEIPEPSGLLLLLTALGGVALRWRPAGRQ